MIAFITLAIHATDIDDSLWSLILKGGWLMIPIVLLSIVAIFIACERFWMIRKTETDGDTLVRKTTEMLRAGKEEEAISWCKSNSSPLARMIVKGIVLKKFSFEEIRHGMEDVANYEVALLERGLSTLGSCSNLAPMVGFLGTVIGMVQAFYDMAMAGSDVNLDLLSRGIYTALITTVAGLIVGIIGNFAYNYLVSLVEKRVFQMEKAMSDFMDTVRSMKEMPENQ